MAVDGKRVLILAPIGRDAPSAATILERHQIEAVICPTLAAAAAQVGPHAGAVLATEEAFLREDPQPLIDAVTAQPKWSDLPFVVLAARRSGPSRASERARSRLPAQIANVVVLERPLGSVSLLSAIDWALAARQRQFQLRDHLQELELRASQLRASQLALLESQNELRLVTDSVPALILLVDLQGIVRFANRAVEQWFYVSSAYAVGRSWGDLFGSARLATLQPSADRALRGDAVELGLGLPHRDGRRRDADVRLLPRFDRQGRVDALHVIVQDITDRNLGEEILRDAAEMLERRVADRTTALEREVSERERAEDALRQAQKMEAVGQLTGGIAHDFNNMLTGIIGSLAIMKRRIEAGKSNDLQRYMDAATASAQRAASLTHRLLAFSRRQSLDIKAVEPNELVISLQDLLQRTLGEAIDLQFELGEELPWVEADTNQLESAILNLAINSRDAMTNGGKLTISTRLHEAGKSPASGMGAGTTVVGEMPREGDFVVLAVTDNGSGMTAATLKKAFEPFFTTKPIGQGTGLGLSMIYGYVNQSGGTLRMASGEGVGTRVELYLPIANQRSTAEPVHAEPLPAPLGSGETVLVVEDDPAVRLLVLDVLRELGYSALEAAEPTEAIRLLEASGRIDLLVSDVGLPGINGRQLAEIARQHRPDLRVLFMTGYARGAVVRSGFLGERMDMMSKPFSLESLAVKIRDMMAA